MPVHTRSLHTFATTIINNIVDNVVNHPGNPESKQNIQTNDNGMNNSSSKVEGVSTSASLELGCCSICCDDIQFDKGRFVLECGHTFHAKCILVELRHRNRCPMCRTEVAESSAHKQSYMMPSSLRMYSSILHNAADHFVHDLGNITFANVVHRMMLLSSEDQDIRSIQYPYIKRLLVQFASILIRGIAFSVRDHENDAQMQDPVPIDIVDDMMQVDDDSDYDAAISNPALDAAVAYHAMVTTDMDFDSSSSSSSSHNDNVGSVLIRRSVALAEMGLQRSELSLRRSRRLVRRQQQFQEVHQLLQEAIREREQRQREQQSQSNIGENENESNSEVGSQNINMVISHNPQQPQHFTNNYDGHGGDGGDDDSAPYGLEF